MQVSTPPTEADIRDQAYFFWEQDGRPFGRDHEYWSRAAVFLAEKADADSLMAPPPRQSKAVAAEAKASPKLKSGASKATKKPSAAAPKAPSKLKSAATRAKPVPSKSSRPDGKKT